MVEGKGRAEVSSGKWEEGGMRGDPRRDPGFGTLEVSGHRGRASGEPREAERDTHRGAETNGRTDRWTETKAWRKGTRKKLGEAGTGG